ncbi:MAG: FMN-binding protein [Actinomycetota bacterium]|nr:FMN-binding protein [Actinomycetota bacterium]
MRRSVSVLLATVVVLVLLANFHTSPSGTAQATIGDTTPTTQVARGSEPPAGASPTGGGGLGPPSSVTAPATTAPRANTATRTVTGPTEENRYGPVQVQVTLSGNRIVDVQALQLPSDRSRSQQINSVAGPDLRQEVLAAQSAQVHTISGATYTSTGYRQSLQAALDQAGRG